MTIVLIDVFLSAPKKMFLPLAMKYTEMISTTTISTWGTVSLHALSDRRTKTTYEDNSLIEIKLL